MCTSAARAELFHHVSVVVGAMSSVLAWLSGAVSWVPEWLTIFIIVAGSMITFACCMCWKCDRDEAAYWRERASGNQAEEQEEGAGDAALAAEEQEEGTGTTAQLRAHAPECELMLPAPECEKTASLSAKQQNLAAASNTEKLTAVWIANLARDVSGRQALLCADLLDCTTETPEAALPEVVQLM